jgi:uncharacterized protein Usg
MGMVMRYVLKVYNIGVDLDRVISVLTWWERERRLDLAPYFPVLIGFIDFSPKRLNGGDGASRSRSQLTGVIRFC